MALSRANLSCWAPSSCGPRGVIALNSSGGLGTKTNSPSHIVVRRAVHHTEGVVMTAAASRPEANNRRGRVVVCNATFKVKFITPDGEVEIDAADDAYLLDTAEEFGMDLPYSCRAGSCGSCAGKIMQGEVDQSEGVQLSDDQKDEGYLLTCISYPRSDVVIETSKEEELM